MSRLPSDFELRRFKHFQREGFERLGEDADHWLVGLVQLGKHRPVVRGGEVLHFTSLSGAHAIFKQAPEQTLHPDSRFELIKLEQFPRPQPAILFLTGGEPVFYPGCWFHPDHEHIAQLLVDFLNEEVKRRLAGLPPGDHPQGPDRPPWWATYDPADD